MLTVTRLGLPPDLRRSLACTNIIENVLGTVRRVCRNVKYLRSPSMALRSTGAVMLEAAKGFRRLKDGASQQKAQEPSAQEYDEEEKSGLKCYLPVPWAVLKRTG
jgi:hypothetical protein